MFHQQLRGERPFNSTHCQKAVSNAQPKSNNMHLGTTITKSSEQVKNPIKNKNNQLQFRPLTQFNSGIKLDYSVPIKNENNQLQFRPVTQFNSGIKLDCYAKLDNCSSCSYILSKTAETPQCKPSKIYSLAYEVLSVRTKFLKLWSGLVSDHITLLSLLPLYNQFSQLNL